MIGFIVVGVAVSAARPTRVTPYYVLNEQRERAEAAANGRRLLVIIIKAVALRRRRPRRSSKRHTYSHSKQDERDERKKTFESRNLKVINMIAIHSRVW